MITRYASEEPMARELLIAGLRPLPINRMLRQAGREANQFYTRGDYGSPLRQRDKSIWRYSDGTPHKGQLRSGPMPDDMKERTRYRLEKAQDAINNWDPIEASAAEDYNRMRGQNRRGDPSAAFDLIHTIDTPTHEGVSLGEMMVPRI